jgi:hypothetical protein
MKNNYRISIKIGDVDFEIESTNVKWVEAKEKAFLQKMGKKQIGDAVESRDASRESTMAEMPPQITLNEFYRKYVHKIKSRPTIAVLLLYYLEKIQKKDKIKTGDVANCFRDIHYPNWNKLNMTYILTNAKHRALVNYVNKLWSLTTTGEDFVLNMLSGKSK